MNIRTRIASAAAAVALTGAAVVGGAFVSPAGATGLPAFGHGGNPAVFVQTDNLSGNQVVAYDRAANGSLTQAGSYATHGLGGQLAGSQVDHTASEGALAYDATDARLFAVNAGSNTVSVFAVEGDHLTLLQVIGSGGDFPVSIAVHGDLVEVLNARNGGTVQGYRQIFGFLLPLFGGNRPLGLDPTATPEFTHTPGQVTFTPDGSKVLVTTKANTNAIDVFRVGFDGRLSASPVVNTFAGSVPFGVTFDAQGHAVVAATGLGAVNTYTVHSDGTLTQIASVATNQAATCWVVGANGNFYASNAGSATVTGFQDDGNGQLTSLGNTATDGGTVDATFTSNGSFLYVQAGAAGNVDGFRVGAGGALTPVGSVVVPNAAGGEGIIAS